MRSDLKIYLCKMIRSARGGNRIKYLTAVAASPSVGFTFLAQPTPSPHFEQSQIFLGGGRGGRSSSESPVEGAAMTAWLASSTKTSVSAGGHGNGDGSAWKEGVRKSGGGLELAFK